MILYQLNLLFARDKKRSIFVFSLDWLKIDEFSYVVVIVVFFVILYVTKFIHALYTYCIIITDIYSCAKQLISRTFIWELFKCREQNMQ